MFRNLSTSKKLLLLCGIFFVTLGVTTYSLVAEKQIAVNFAKKELIGNRYIAILRSMYDAILTGSAKSGLPPHGSADRLLNALSLAEDHFGGTLQTAEFERSLVSALRVLWSNTTEGANVNIQTLDTLVKVRRLISHIGDNSNLTLDPDLDSFYVQDIVVSKLPAWLGQLAELRALARESLSAGMSRDERKVRFLILEGLLNSAADDVQKNLAAAYRGNTEGSLKEAVGGAFETMFSATHSYLDDLNTAVVDGQPARIDLTPLDRRYASAVGSATAAWAVAQSELDRLLRKRIEDLLKKLRASLILTGTFGALSLLVALLTHRLLVRPIERLEAVARTVRETKNYGLRVDHDSQDEIGRLTVAFNDMLSELSAARARETSEQAELARVARLTTAGAMTASIAHEVNQPLAAIVANGNAALRWLAHKEPNLEEARGALKSIVRDGHRASDVIESVRAIFKKDRGERICLSINGLVREVLILAQGNLQNHQISVRIELSSGLPDVLADRLQLQQVLLNLIINAAEAMGSAAGRERFLLLTTDSHDTGRVLIKVADTGPGVDSKDIDRIFEPFYTTKPSGMGMGLAICRAIIESHGGQLWVAPADPNGSVFHVALPCRAVDGQ